ncbi:LacI family DNA-binding transcriptional regulator [Clostridiaceae bacterium HSG29]|nr:LacI family DNA-binding transcriptional regulator [Clostridiaceae bacterium HSG29]
MNVTMKDVAIKANVSTSTVSRVISGNKKISDDTRKKVFKVMEELNYHPNVSARNLARSKTRTLGLVLPGATKEFLHNPFFIKVIAGISKFAKENDYYIMYSNTDNEDDEIVTLNHFIRAGVVDGIILTTVRLNDKSIELLRSLDMPYVTIGRQREYKDSLWVDNDNVNAMYNLVEHLIKKGKKNIAFIGGDIKYNVTNDRLNGYKKALNDNNITFNNDIVEEAEYLEKSGYDAFQRIISKFEVDAVVTTDDVLAFGVYKVIEERKLSKNIAVAGFNNTPLSEYREPTLTSVDILEEELGYNAARLLINKLENGNIETTNYVVNTKLIVRESTL